jgi:hypothetical protein
MANAWRLFGVPESTLRWWLSAHNEEKESDESVIAAEMFFSGPLTVRQECEVLQRIIVR